MGCDTLSRVTACLSVVSTDHDLIPHQIWRGAQGRSKTSSVLDAVATTAPDSSVTTPSVKPTREPPLVTVPVAVSRPRSARTALS